MRQFDEFLRQGLMGANLAQYEGVLRGLPDWEPDFSPQYRRERMRLLADPWKWVRRRARPLWRRIARSAACIVLTSAVLFGALLAASPTVRAKVAQWVQETFWGVFFDGLGQRQQAIVDGMEIGGDTAEPSADGPLPQADPLLPPPAEHDGVTVTPLRILGAKNRLYLVLEIRAPEGTVLTPEGVGLSYSLFGSLRPSPAWSAEHPTEMPLSGGRFSVLEAGTREPNVLVGVVEDTTSFDVGGASYQIRALYRQTETGERETVFEAPDFKTGAWEIPIPEDLNESWVLEPQVEGVSLTWDGRTMTLQSMGVSPLGIWWNYRQADSTSPWPQEVRVALRMADGREIEALQQLSTGDMGYVTGSASFEKPVDLSQAEAVLWGDAVIPLEQPEN